MTILTRGATTMVNTSLLSLCSKLGVKILILKDLGGDHECSLTPLLPTYTYELYSLSCVSGHGTNLMSYFSFIRLLLTFPEFFHGSIQLAVCFVV